MIGCVGNFTPGKRQIDLLKAFPEILKSMPDARLRFLGSGSELGACKKYACESGFEDKVEFSTEIPHTDIPKFYNSLDVYVHPSVNEAFCCVLIEAQACGVPIICCKGISAEEVMTEVSKRVCLIDPYSPDDIVKAVIQVREVRIKTSFSRNLDIDVQARYFLEWIKI